MGKRSSTTPRTATTSAAQPQQPRPAATPAPAKSRASSKSAAAATAQPDQPNPQYRVAYSGWTPAAGAVGIAEVEYASLTPERFYREYVAQRRPVLLRGGCPTGGDEAATPAAAASEFAPLARNWTSPSYLRAHAGQKRVRVEWKERGGKGGFGRGQHVWMPFNSFLSLVGCKGDEGIDQSAEGKSSHEALAAQHGQHALYLTSQPIPSGSDGAPLELCAEPVSSLMAAMPLRPRLFETLAPVQFNAWMGSHDSAPASASAPAAAPLPPSSPYFRSPGSSSGLHHDYHDNAYLLLQGRKTFHLFPPSAAPFLYPHGVPLEEAAGKAASTDPPACIVHPNGVIEYTSVDGRNGSDVDDEEEEAEEEEPASAASGLSARQKQLQRELEEEMAEDEEEGEEEEGEEEEEEGEDEEGDGSGAEASDDEDGEDQEEEGEDEEDAEDDPVATAAAAAAAAAESDEAARLLFQSKSSSIHSQLADLRRTHTALGKQLDACGPADAKRRKNLSIERDNVGKKVAGLVVRLEKLGAEEEARVKAAEERVRKEKEAAEAAAAAAAKAKTKTKGTNNDGAADDDDEDDDEDGFPDDMDLDNLRDDYEEEEGEEGEEEDEDEEESAPAPSKRNVKDGSRKPSSKKQAARMEEESEEEEEEEEDDEDAEIDPAEREAWRAFMAATKAKAQQKKGTQKGESASSRKRKETPEPAAAAVSAPTATGKGGPAAKKAKTAATSSAAPVSSSTPPRPVASESFPPNFSRLDFATLTPTQLAQRFPRFSATNKRCVPLRVQVAQGDLLYLPAGWWHEVFSSSAEGGGQEESTPKGKGQGPASASASASSLPPNLHLALNYWFHPPSDGGGSMASPYTREDMHAERRYQRVYRPRVQQLQQQAIHRQREREEALTRKHKAKTNAATTTETKEPAAAKQKKRKNATTAVAAPTFSSSKPRTAAGATAKQPKHARRA